MKRILILLPILVLLTGHPASAQIGIGASYLKTHVTANHENGSGEGF